MQSDFPGGRRGGGAGAVDVSPLVIGGDKWTWRFNGTRLGIVMVIILGIDNWDGRNQSHSFSALS